MTEYKVLTLSKGMVMSNSREKTAEILRDLLNENAKLGWKFKQLEGFFVILEKD